MSISALSPLRGDLTPRLKEVVGVLNRAHAELVGITAEALENESWAEDGILSPRTGSCCGPGCRALGRRR